MVACSGTHVKINSDAAVSIHQNVAALAAMREILGDITWAVFTTVPGQTNPF